MKKYLGVAIAVLSLGYAVGSSAEVIREFLHSIRVENKSDMTLMIAARRFGDPTGIPVGPFEIPAHEERTMVADDVVDTCLYSMLAVDQADTSRYLVWNTNICTAVFWTIHNLPLAFGHP